TGGRNGRFWHECEECAHGGGGAVPAVELEEDRVVVTQHGEERTGDGNDVAKAEPVRDPYGRHALADITQSDDNRRKPPDVVPDVHRAGIAVADGPNIATREQVHHDVGRGGTTQ